MFFKVNIVRKKIIKKIYFFVKTVVRKFHLFCERKFLGISLICANLNISEALRLDPISWKANWYSLIFKHLRIEICFFVEKIIAQIFIRFRLPWSERKYSEYATKTVFHVKILGRKGRGLLKHLAIFEYPLIRDHKKSDENLPTWVELSSNSSSFSASFLPWFFTRSYYKSTLNSTRQLSL